MQGGQHQVAGEAGLDGDLGGFEVADFTDHDHVRILPQDGAQGLGEGELDLRIDLDLADAGQVVFDRVFDGDDVAALGVHALQCGVERGALAGAGGAGDEEDAVGFLEQFGKGRHGALRHAQAVEAALTAALVEQAQHDALAVGGGQRGYAHVHLAAGQAQGDAAILGQALFGDVEAGHDLDPRGHGGVQGPVRLGYVDQHAVAAKAHHGVLLVGLDVDVAGLLAHGLGQQGVDHADDRRVVLGVEKVFDGRQLGHQLGEVDLLADVVDHGGGVAVGAGISFGNAGFEGGARDALDVQRHAEVAAHFGEGRQIGPFAQDQLGVLGAPGGDENAVGLGKGVGQGRRAHRVLLAVGSTGAAAAGAGAAAGGVTGCSRGG